MTTKHSKNSTALPHHHMKNAPKFLPRSGVPHRNWCLVNPGFDCISWISGSFRACLQAGRVVVCRDLIWFAVATFWAMSLVDIYPGRASAMWSMQSEQIIFPALCVFSRVCHCRSHVSTSSCDWFTVLLAGVFLDWPALLILSLVLVSWKSLQNHSD